VIDEQQYLTEVETGTGPGEAESFDTLGDTPDSLMSFSALGV